MTGGVTGGEKNDLLPSECIVRVDLLIHHHPCLALETPESKDQGEGLVVRVR